MLLKNHENRVGVAGMGVAGQRGDFNDSDATDPERSPATQKGFSGLGFGFISGRSKGSRLWCCTPQPWAG